MGRGKKEAFSVKNLRHSEASVRVVAGLYLIISVKFIWNHVASVFTWVRKVVNFPMGWTTRSVTQICLAEGRAPWMCNLDHISGPRGHCGPLSPSPLLESGAEFCVVHGLDGSVHRILETEKWLARVPVLLPPQPPPSSALLQVKYPLSEIIGTKEFQTLECWEFWTICMDFMIEHL